MKKRQVIAVFLLVGILGVLAGCTKEQIKIGVIGTMSGASSDLAVTGRRGAETAVREINEQGGIDGREVVLVVKDDGNDPEQAARMLDEYIEEGVRIVIGHYTSGMMMSVIDQVNSNEILYLSPTVSADELSDRDDHFIRFIASTRAQADVLTQVALVKGDKDFIVVIDEKNKGFNSALYDNFNSRLTDNGGQVLDTLYFDTLDRDSLEDICESVCKTQNDGVLIIANASDFALLAQNFHKAGVKVQLYGPLWAHTSDLLMYGGDAVDGSYLVGAVDYESTSQEFNTVNARYKETFGADMTFSSVFSYETVMAVKEAIELKDSSDWDRVKEGILDIGTFKGLQKDYVIDAYGDSNRKYIVETIIDEKFKRIDQWE